MDISKSGCIISHPLYAAARLVCMPGKSFLKEHRVLKHVYCG